jgi:hypothetical protein
MGANVSTQVSNQISTSVNTAMTNMVTENESSTAAVTVNANNIDIDLRDAIIDGCGLDFTQKVDASQDVRAMAKFTSVSDMQQQLIAALQNEAKQGSEQKQQALSMSVAVATGIQNINQAISNHVTTNLRSSTLNKVNAHLANKNGVRIRGAGLECKNSKFKVDQSIVSKQTTQLLTDTIMNTKNDMRTDTKAASKGEQKTVIDQEGIQGVISSIGLTIMLPLFICMGVVLVIMGPGLIKGMSAKKGKFFFGSRLRKIRFGGGRRW